MRSEISKKIGEFNSSVIGHFILYSTYLGSFPLNWYLYIVLPWAEYESDFTFASIKMNHSSFL